MGKVLAVRKYCPYDGVRLVQQELTLGSDVILCWVCPDCGYYIPV